MKKETKMKFVFVLIIGIILAVVVLNRLFSNDDERTNSEFDFVEDEHILDSTEFESTADNGLKDGIIEEETLIEEEPDFEEEYKKKYGKKSYEEAKELAKIIVKMWVEEESDKTKWKQYSTSSFLNQIQKELLEYSDGINREVTDLEVSEASPNKENEMKFRVMASWNILNNETIVRKQTKIFYVILTVSNNQKWLVKELVEV